jgi:hypothetical protein
MSARSRTDTNWTPCPSCTVAPTDRLAAVLAAGLRFGPSTGVVHTRPPSTTCVICHEPLFGCKTHAQDDELADGGGDYANCADGDQWTMRMDPETRVELPVVTLTACQHQFHVHCIAKWLTECPVCRGAIVQQDVSDVREAMAKLESEKKGETRVQNDDGNVEFYLGQGDSRRKVRVEQPDGEKKFFEGEKDDERLVRVEQPYGEKKFFEGEKDAERLVRVKVEDLGEKFYEGEKGAEHFVRIEFVDGDKHFFDGEKGAERYVRIEYRNGRKEFYEGDRPATRLVRAEYPNGQKHFYEGEKGAERKVRSEYPDGQNNF